MIKFAESYKSFLLLIVLGCSTANGIAQDKKIFEGQYKNKFLVLLKDGLAVGICAEPNSQSSPTPDPVLKIEVADGVAVYHEQSGMTDLLLGCRLVVPEPLHKGEILSVTNAIFRGKSFHLLVTNIAPHAIDRGVGAFTHQSNERGKAAISFKLVDSNDIKQTTLLLNSWFKEFDTQDAAMKFGNTESGVYVKQIRAGMTIAEVETNLGQPLTRIDLSDKILYKYKDMTVEFRDGKVTDVR